ncbi:MAG: VTT domain-containing protein [Candidatus Bathyarchaeota archaeon]|nr:VTT domain-containing protein [Candidatus Bathyarchaeota archaeon]
MATLIELTLVFLSSFGFNMIPFAGPSNLFIASTAALTIGSTEPATLGAVGLLVALGASIAKSVHYLVTFFIGKRLSPKRRQRLDKDAEKIKGWAFLLLIAAAATPIPDEPVVVPLGLMKYSPAKFFTAFFLGKLSITLAGAFLGAWTNTTFSEFLSQEAMIILSIALTIIVTIILLKVDVGEFAEKIFRRRPKTTDQDKDSATTNS